MVGKYRRLLSAAWLCSDAKRDACLASNQMRRALRPSKWLTRGSNLTCEQQRARWDGDSVSIGQIDDDRALGRSRRPRAHARRDAWRCVGAWVVDGAGGRAAYRGPGQLPITDKLESPLDLREDCTNLLPPSAEATPRAPLVS